MIFDSQSVKNDNRFPCLSVCCCASYSRSPIVVFVPCTVTSVEIAAALLVFPMGLILSNENDFTMI